MATGDGFTSRLLVGLAEHLHTAGIGTWRTSGAYAAGETAIVLRAIPQAPDRIVTLAAYPIASGLAGLADDTIGVQVRTRGTGEDPRDVDDLADAVYELLDSATGLTLGGVAVVQILRRSYTSLGQDTSRRWERSDNYAIDVMRPTAHRTD